MSRLRGITTSDLITSSMAEAEFNAGFNEWFTAGVAAGQIPPNSDKFVYLCKFAAGQLEKSAGLLRETRDIGVGLKQQKAQLLSESRRRDEELSLRRDGLKEDERAVRALKDQGRQIATIDGSDLGVLRTWVEQVGRAGRVARAKGSEIVRFALSHSKGNLHEVIYSVYEDNDVCTWEEVRDRLVNLFLTAREATALVDVVFNLEQADGELMSAYCMRYSTAVQRAWPNKGLMAMGAVHDMVVKKFEDSLTEPIVRLAVRLSRSDSLEKAMAVARENEEGLAGRHGKRSSVMRVEEPMEVGAVNAHQKGKSGTQGIGTDQTTFKQLQGELKSLRKLMVERTERPVQATHLAIAPAPAAPSTVVVQTAPPAAVSANQGEGRGAPRQGGSQGSDRRKCTFCQRMGHLEDKCREKKIVEKYAQSGVGSPSQTGSHVAQSGN